MARQNMYRMVPMGLFIGVVALACMLVYESCQGLESLNNLNSFL